MKSIIEKLKANENKSLKVSGIILAIFLVIVLINPNLKVSLNRNNLPKGRGISKVELYLKENFDRFAIDGSTSLIPLHQALKNLFGEENGETEVYHNRTVDAFEMFINGEVDVLLCVDYSKELLDKAKEKGIDLARLEITKEAFVFLVNENNPVKNLTIEQIKDIYSGVIMNWREVGGNDAEIIPFQRNSDSGSQMQMVMLMGDRELIKENAVYYYGMSDIIKAIVNYDEGVYSIAYNMYTFTEKQYEDSEVTLIPINGISPTDESIGSGEYPLVIYNYIYYDRNNAKSSEFAINLHNYLMSPRGKKLIGESGYINLDGDYARNKEIKNEHYSDFEFFEILPFYDEEKGVYYRIDENQSLLVYTSYADYLLDNTKYENNINARDFLEGIDHLEMLDYYHVQFDHSEGIFYLFNKDYYEFPALDYFGFRYNDKYYNYLRYYIDDDKYELVISNKDAFELALDNGLFIGYLNLVKNIAFDKNVILTKDEIENVFILITKSVDQDGLEYTQLFH